MKQTDAAQTPLPRPVGTAEMNLVDQSWAWDPSTPINQDATGAILNPAILYGSYYAPPTYPQFATGDAITLSGLFKWRRETIDPVQDAKTAPGHFAPRCGFTGQLLLRGGNCGEEKLGWYNVPDPLSKTPPAKTQVYPFVSAPGSSLNCTQEDGITPKTDGFCPLAWDNRGPRQLDKIRWTPITFPSGDLSQDAHYGGGDVAFAMIGAATGKCTQSKYTMYEHNQRNAQSVPWVTSLIYRSTVDPNGYYLAFEELGMPADDWTGSGADGDFNDMVYYVSFTPCPGVGGNGGTGGTAGADAGASGASAGNGGAATSAGASDGGTSDVAQGGSAGTDQTDDTAGEPNAVGGAHTVGGSRARGGATARGGASSMSGATTTGGTLSDSPASGSSSCGCAVPGERSSQRVLPLLALLFGFAITRRTLRKNAKCL